MDENPQTRPFVLDVFGDPLCRNILVAAIDAPISAASLADRLDVSPPTVYKRLDALLEYDLVAEHRRVGDDGTHFRVFESSPQRVVIEVDDAGYTVDVELHRDLDDRFEGFWTQFADSSQRTRDGLESSASRSRRKRDPSST